MYYNPSIHQRQSIRLKGYDYSREGLYFITLCTQDRKCLFGEIVVPENVDDAECFLHPPKPQMELNDAGKMVENEWELLRKRFPNIRIHDFVVMPNHFHGILEIVGMDVGSTVELDVASTLVVDNYNMDSEIDGQPIEGQPRGLDPTDKTVGDMVGAYKSITTVEYIHGVKNLGWPPFNGKLWQRNYYERIIRDEKSYRTISEYIQNNPAKWNADRFQK